VDDCLAAGIAFAKTPGIGRVALTEEVAAWNFDVLGTVSDCQSG
jgi:hypothetical protein